MGGNPFFDPKLEELVGKWIECEGTIAGQTFIIAKLVDVREDRQQ